MTLASLNYLNDFMVGNGLSNEVDHIQPAHLRAFILHLQQKRCWSHHPYARTQNRGLSPFTVSVYLRSIRAFWSWLVAEEVTENNPFYRVKLPKTPRKIVPTFSLDQIRALLSAIDTTTGEGFRDYAIILTLLDTGLRVSELAGLKISDLKLEDGIVKVMGKGSKERLVPIGRQVRKIIWRYYSFHRPQPQNPNWEFLFLNADGRPLKVNRIRFRMQTYGRRTGITGVRCSPHTLRHTAAVSFLRNGGDVFSLQRLLGHASLEMTRHYCQLADVDVRKAHNRASPVDNLVTASGTGLVPPKWKLK